MISLLKMWSVGLLVAQVTVKTSLSYLTSLVVNSESQTGKILFAETSCWDKSQWWATKVREVMVFTLNRISLLFICKLFANIPRRQGIRLGQQLKKKKKSGRVWCRGTCLRWLNVVWLIEDQKKDLDQGKKGFFLRSAFLISQFDIFLIGHIGKYGNHRKGRPKLPEMKSFNWWIEMSTYLLLMK